MYYPRHLEAVLREAVTQFPAVAVMGARQVGKSTLLQELFSTEYTYLTFDDILLRTQAKTDPTLFLKNFPGKLILDEIQYVPELLPEIKIRIDRDKQAGQFLLTGSQQFTLIKGLQESLAGRVLLLHLRPMTLDERCNRGQTRPWLLELLEKGNPLQTTPLPLEVSPIEAIHQGGLPAILSISNKFRHSWFESYIQTYLERDMASILPGSDITGLSRFLRLLAPLSCSEVNKNQLGRELSISPPTSNRWLDRLKATFLWMETPPYLTNYLKRVSKHPKGNLFDTGVICSLLAIPDGESLSLHPLVGTLFEAAMRIEIQAILDAFLIPATVYHWRTHQGVEVDIVLEYKNKLYAFECKWKSDIQKHDLTGLLQFQKIFKEKVAFLGVLTPTGHSLRIREDIYQIPWVAK